MLHRILNFFNNLAHCSPYFMRAPRARAIKMYDASGNKRTYEVDYEITLKQHKVAEFTTMAYQFQ